MGARHAPGERERRASAEAAIFSRWGTSGEVDGRGKARGWRAARRALRGAARWFRAERSAGQANLGGGRARSWRRWRRWSVGGEYSGRAWSACRGLAGRRRSDGSDGALGRAVERCRRGRSRGPGRGGKPRRRRRGWRWRWWRRGRRRGGRRVPGGVGAQNRGELVCERRRAGRGRWASGGLRASLRVGAAAGRACSVVGSASFAGDYCGCTLSGARGHGERTR
jgi:hypothetical protein